MVKLQISHTTDQSGIFENSAIIAVGSGTADRPRSPNVQMARQTTAIRKMSLKSRLIYPWRLERSRWRGGRPRRNRIGSKRRRRH
jgi:hypothetical protein